MLMQGRSGLIWLIWLMATLGTICLADDGAFSESALSPTPNTIALEALEQARELSSKGKLDEALHFYQQTLQRYQQAGMRAEQVMKGATRIVINLSFGDSMVLVAMIPGTAQA